MKRLAGGLAFLCLVLFLLAIEQKHAVETWRALREDAVPAAGRAIDWAAQGLSGKPADIDDLKQAVAGDDAPLAAAEADAVLSGEFTPADPETRDSIGSLSFLGAAVRFESGDSFVTAPLRIASGEERYAVDQTFADRMEAARDAQIELRRIVPASPAEPVAPSALCGGRVPGAIALLHRGNQVDLMLFRARTVVGPDAPPDALCGHWRFHAR
jgi:hypothetical protein